MFKKIDLIEKISKRLEYTLIENLSFEKCIADFDTSDTFFYCDPPHMTKTDYKSFGISFTDEDHLKLFKILKEIKGKFILSYNDCEKVRELYKDFIIEEVVRLNGIERRNIKNNYFKELLIRNYEI